MICNDKKAEKIDGKKLTGLAGLSDKVCKIEIQDERTLHS